MDERDWRYGDRGRPAHEPVPGGNYGDVCVATMPGTGAVCRRGLNHVYESDRQTVRAIRHNPRPYGRAGSA